MHGDRERCMQLGCDGYIPKPVARNELLSIISNFLADNAAKTIAV
jgi:CheY-like chemotaxis protein